MEFQKSAKSVFWGNDYLTNAVPKVKIDLRVSVWRLYEKT